MANYDFVLSKDKEAMGDLLKSLKVLEPVDKNYKLGFQCILGEYGKYYVKITLFTVNDSVKIYESDYIFSENSTKIKKLLQVSGDVYWNRGLEIYRKTLDNSPKQEKTQEEKMLEDELSKIKQYKGIGGRRYAKKHYSLKERLELSSLGYYNFVDGTSYTLFEKILERASNNERMSFDKIKILTKGYNDYENKISYNILFYSVHFLSDQVLEKLYELSLLDSKTSNNLINIKEIIDKEEAEYNRICEITANKKQADINSILETEKIKYMISNGISLQDAFYYVDAKAQESKKDILNAYLRLAKNEAENTEAIDENIAYIANYLLNNVQKKDVEDVIDYVLMDEKNYDLTLLPEDIQNHVSFLKLMKGDKNV